MNEKLTGSYYTPYRAVSFMRKYLLKQNSCCKSILEPCAGDGRFIDAFVDYNTVESIVAVELYEEKTKSLLKHNYPKKVSIVTSDFLKFARKTNQKFQLIIGNPPYINIKNMGKDFLENAKKFCCEYELPNTVIKNSWVAFVLASIGLLDSNGTIFFVLPLEFLQVQYAEQLRGALENRFNTIHILTFSEKMFPKIEQEVCLVYLANQRQNLPYISYRQFLNLDSDEISFESRIERNKPLKKWSNSILSDADIDLLKHTGNPYILIKDLGESSPGIVTGANNKFILTRQEVQKYKCGSLIIPVIAKGVMVRNHFEINAGLIKILAKNGDKVYLLNLAATQEQDLPTALKEYLKEVGGTKRNGKNIKECYKCSKRKPWYGIPIVGSGNLVFFKRYDACPRICTNPMGIHTTDIAYNIRLKEEFDPQSVAFCFYNSLTLAQCEFVGRYYAGGVLELTPSEFKSLSLPYYKIGQEDIDILKKMFSEGATLEEIVQLVNSKTIVHDISIDKICALDNIRLRLMARRNPIANKKLKNS